MLALLAACRRQEMARRRSARSGTSGAHGEAQGRTSPSASAARSSTSAGIKGVGVFIAVNTRPEGA
ncbi:MAG: hypothetical protein MZV63_06525 [Marinilabiliales bacterium]|nr:hypothetical protein [Marinilabiliales bacterium]